MKKVERRALRRRALASALARSPRGVRYQRGRKGYSLHAAEVGGIGKGEAHRHYESGVKVSAATTTLRRSKAAGSSPK